MSKASARGRAGAARKIARARWWLCGLLLLAACWAPSHQLKADAPDLQAYSPVALGNIKVEGLRRVSRGVVYQALDLNIGQSPSLLELQSAQKRLFATGLFDDISLLRAEDVLIVRVVERPSINSINFSGNELLASEELEQSFADQGISAGEILKRSTAELIVSELERVYLSRGRYGTEVELEVVDLGKNNVDLNLNIQEAPETLILEINFVGNSFFDKEQLLAQISTKELSATTAVTSGNRYSAAQLAGDMEKLETRYLNSGFAKVEVRTPAVSISPDRRFININVLINEGKRYSFSELDVSGNLIMEPEQALDLLRIASGETYNQGRIDASVNALENALGDLGYGFARVQPRYEFDDDNATVAVNFVVDPKRRVYVRRIVINGNTSSKDHALRREIVQLEASWFEGQKVRQSMARLRRLKYISEANYELIPVAGSEDLTDLHFNLTQGGFGMISGGLTYSDLSGTALSFSYSAFSAFGSGNDWSISANFNETERELSTSLYEPFFTLDGISRRTSLNYSETDLSDDEEISNYRSDSSGLRHSYGYPVALNSRVEAGLSYTQYALTIGDEPTLNISEYVDDYGDEFEDAYFFLSLTRNTLDRGILPMAGSYHSGTVNTTLGKSANAYYRLDYRNQLYFPFSSRIRELGLRLETRLGYINTYAGDEHPPFYRHYFLGTVNGVRGFNSLAPKATEADGTESSLSWGGNISMLERVDFIVPLFVNQQGVRTSLFYDIGNSYHNNCIVDSEWCEQGISLDSLRQSYGFSLQWYTPIGPLGIIWSWPLNAEDEDSTTNFNFFIGQALY